MTIWTIPLKFSYVVIKRTQTELPLIPTKIENNEKNIQ